MPYQEVSNLKIKTIDAFNVSHRNSFLFILTNLLFKFNKKGSGYIQKAHREVKQNFKQTFINEKPNDMIKMKQRLLCQMLALVTLLMISVGVQATTYYLVGSWDGKWDSASSYAFTIDGTTGTVDIPASVLSAGSSTTVYFSILAIESASNQWRVNPQETTLIEAGGASVSCASSNNYNNQSLQLNDPKNTGTYTVTMTAVKDDINASNVSLTYKPATPTVTYYAVTDFEAAEYTTNGLPYTVDLSEATADSKLTIYGSDGKFYGPNVNGTANTPDINFGVTTDNLSSATTISEATFWTLRKGYRYTVSVSNSQSTIQASDPNTGGSTGDGHGMPEGFGGVILRYNNAEDLPAPIVHELRNYFKVVDFTSVAQPNANNVSNLGQYFDIIADIQANGTRPTGYDGYVVNMGEQADGNATDLTNANYGSPKYLIGDWLNPNLMTTYSEGTYTQPYFVPVDNYQAGVMDMPLRNFIKKIENGDYNDASAQGWQAFDRIFHENKTSAKRAAVAGSNGNNVWDYNRYAVTFVNNNHATDFTDVEGKRRAYAAILMLPATPVVNYEDYANSGLTNDLRRLMQIRKWAGITSTSTYVSEQKDKHQVYSFIIQGKFAQIKTVVGQEDYLKAAETEGNENVPGTGDRNNAQIGGDGYNYTLLAEGTGWRVWYKGLGDEAIRVALSPESGYYEGDVTCTGQVTGIPGSGERKFAYTTNGTAPIINKDGTPAEGTTIVTYTWGATNQSGKVGIFNQDTQIVKDNGGYVTIIAQAIKDNALAGNRDTVTYRFKSDVIPSVVVPVVINKLNKNFIRSFSHSKVLDLPEDGTVKAFVAHHFTKADGSTTTGTVYLYQINYIPANTGVILVGTDTPADGETSKTYNLTERTDAEVDYTTNPSLLWTNNHDGEVWRNYLVPTVTSEKIKNGKIDQQYLDETGKYHYTERNFAFLTYARTKAGKAENVVEGSNDDYYGFFRASGNTGDNKAYLRLYAGTQDATFHEINSQDLFYDGTYNSSLDDDGQLLNQGQDTSNPAFACAFVLFDADFDNVTGIKEVNTDKKMTNGKYYNLQGVEVTNPTKGIYIHNGRKLIIR